MCGLWVTTRVFVPGSGMVATIARNASVRRLFSFGLTTNPPSVTSSVACGAFTDQPGRLRGPVEAAGV